MRPCRRHGCLVWMLMVVAVAWFGQILTLTTPILMPLVGVVALDFWSTLPDPMGAPSTALTTAGRSVDHHTAADRRMGSYEAWAMVGGNGWPRGAAEMGMGGGRRCTKSSPSTPSPPQTMGRSGPTWASARRRRRSAIAQHVYSNALPLCRGSLGVRRSERQSNAGGGVWIGGGRLRWVWIGANLTMKTWC